MTELAASGVLALDGMALEYRWIAPPRPGAPTLVFLHEGLGCVALWKDFPDRVATATGCGAFVYSRAGYGRSSPVSLPRPLHYMHDEALAVLPQVLAAVKLGPVILVGHSDGASIALIHAGGGVARDVLGVAVLAPHVMNEEICVASIRQAKQAYEAGDLRPRLARLHGDNVDCAFWGWNGAWLDPDFMAWNITKYLPDITVPLLVIQGHDDEYGSAVQYHAIATGCPGSVDVVVLNDCRHSPHRDQPEATLDCLVRFIAELKGRP